MNLDDLPSREVGRSSATPPAALPLRTTAVFAAASVEEVAVEVDAATVTEAVAVVSVVSVAVAVAVSVVLSVAVAVVVSVVSIAVAVVVSVVSVAIAVAVSVVTTAVSVAVAATDVEAVLTFLVLILFFLGLGTAAGTLALSGLALTLAILFYTIDVR